LLTLRVAISKKVACVALQSKKVIGGSIDMLEAIGRKTYDVLAEGEHGLKKTIVKSRESRPTLSQARLFYDTLSSLFYCVSTSVQGYVVELTD